MKRFSLLILTLFFGMLLAQVQELPDIEVGGGKMDSIILLKKEIPKNFMDPETGELPNFIPYDTPFLSDEEEEAKSKAYSWYLDIHGGGDNELYAGVKLTNIRSRLKSLYAEAYIDLNTLTLIGDWEMWQAQGFDFTLSKNTDLFTRVYQKGQVSNNNTYSLITGAISTYSESFELGELDLRKIINEIDANWYVADNGMDGWSFGARHQSEAVWDNYMIGNSFVLDEKESALHSFARYYHHDEANIGLHIMFDKHSFFPSLGFAWRNVLDYDSHLIISNEPRLVHSSFRALSEQFAWTDIGKTQRNNLVPLNLSFAFQKNHFGSSPIRLEVANTTTYESAKPVRHYNADSDIAEIVFDKYFSNTSYAGILYQGKGYHVEQIASFEIPYLPNTEENWLPYHAPFKLITKAGVKPIEKLELGMILEQQARRKDLDKSALPYIADVSLFGSYYLDDFNRMYLNIENLLNMDIEEYHMIPKKKLKAFIGLEVRF